MNLLVVVNLCGEFDGLHCFSFKYCFRMVSLISIIKLKDYQTVATGYSIIILSDVKMVIPHAVTPADFSDS